ncbi:biotin/lipoyl-containing protein [Sulfurospirillum sp. UCH001]|uniref:biotin/lipoyl-containing protein n=1 Tax=Sulfurospirillum sp. UCH001 TaxID=1581011 RepID=UPI00082FA07C|nr:biotin/lipoyl-containing protein [Sulfurospirillum sp. UCH001]
MAKKYIDVMDTTFRDGFQSVFGGRVLMDDFLPAVAAARDAGISHFEFGGGARFQSLYFYLNEDAFVMMDKFREIAGPNANLQTLARGVNTVMLDTGNRELIDLHAKMFKKHGTTTIRNFDALNDVENLKYSGERIVHHGLKHEIVVTMMDLPPKCVGAHDVAFYEKTLRAILDSGIPYHSICFKDASGTSSPQKVYETLKMARKLVPEGTHLRLHTHETAGVSVACYLAALEAGVDGIDLAASPVSGGTSQPDILTMLHAVKGKDYDLGGLELEKILTYEDVLQDCLKDYFMPPEAVQVSPLIPFSPMPGGALTANTQMLRDNNILHKFPEVIKAMREVVEKGGYGTSVTPVSQFYFQQAFNNVMFGPWVKIAEGYGKMVLGYFGRTPVTPNAEVVALASQQLKLEPTTKNALELADADETKSLSHVRKMLEEANLTVTDENLLIAAACKEKGIAFLKGEAKVNVRKIEKEKPATPAASTGSSEFTVTVNGQKYHVRSEGNDTTFVIDGEVYIIDVKDGAEEGVASCSAAASNTNGGREIKAGLPGSIFKVLVNEGDKVKKGQPVIVIEAMKMEIEVTSPEDGVVSSVKVKQGDTIVNNQVLVTL